MAKATKATGGSASLKAAKKKLVWAPFTETEYARIRRAAGAAGQPMSAFVVAAALAAAEEILKPGRRAT